MVLAVAIGAVLVIALLAAVRAAVPTPSGRTAPPLSTGPGVVYEATGDAVRALVTYGRNGAASRENGVGLPWSTRSTSGDGHDTYTLTVQSSTAVAGLITCRIRVDGEVIAAQTSSARYSAVS